MAPPNPLISDFFQNLPDASVEEKIEIIAQTENITIERIVSHGQSSEWFDQDETEFCTVLAGSAKIQFNDDPEPALMKPGSWVIIPAHCRHKVTWTEPDVNTVWIAFKWNK